MSSRGRTWSIGLVAIAALLWWLALDRRAPPQDLQPSAASPEPVPLLRPSRPAPAAVPAASATADASRAEAAPAALEPEAPPTAAAPIPPDTRGFVAALKQVFETGPRSSDAGEAEGALRQLFRRDGVPAGMLRSVLCRQFVCKLELRWTPEHDQAWRSAMDELTAGNAKNLATQAEEPDASGAVSVEAYWRRAAWQTEP